MENIKKISSNGFLYLLIAATSTILFKFMLNTRGEDILFMGISLFFTLTIFGGVILTLGNILNINQNNLSNNKSAGIQYNLSKPQKKLIGLTAIFAIILYVSLLHYLR